MQGRGQLQLAGVGDSGRSEAFSFLRVPLKTPSQVKQKQQPAPKAAVTGTDADLRKLSLENARLVLLKFGVSEERIAQLTRWERIALVRKLSSEAKETGDSTLTKFARGSRYSAQVQQQQYKKQCQQIFEQQLQAISRTDIESDGSDIEESLETLLASPESEPVSPITTPITTPINKRRADELNEEEELLEAEAVRKMLQESAYDKDIKSSAGSNLLNNLNYANQLRFSAPTFPIGLSDSLRASRYEIMMGSPPLTPKDGEPKRRIQAIKRITSVKNPDGTEGKKEEIIRDPKLIQEILNRKKTAYEGKKKPRLTIEEEEEKNKLRKEKRRLQEQLRRLKKK